MRRIGLCLLLLGSLLGTVTTRASAEPPDATQILRAARSAIIIPPEWDGVWVTADSTYDCLGAFQNTDVDADTLCAGKDYQAEPPDPTYSFSCTGTADATTVSFTCTGSVEVFPDCMANVTMVTHGTRTGDTYSIVTTMTITYSGTGTGCEFFPPQCSQTNSHGTRTGPAPPEYCATAAHARSWGELKIRYR